MMPTNAGSAAFATAMVDDTDARKYATTAQAQHTELCNAAVKQAAACVMCAEVSSRRGSIRIMHACQVPDCASLQAAIA